MKLNKSKSLYVMVLASFMSLAVVDMKQTASETISYTIQPENRPTQGLSTVSINQNIDNNATETIITSVLLPCD